MTSFRTQIAIIGGGVTGLWLLNALTSRGYATICLEKDDLGGQQTLASQGMIHGGIKYALGGFATPSSETIAAMPNRWRACIAGEGSVDLQCVSLLSEDYYLFSDSRLSSRVTAFFGSKSIRGRVEPLAREKYPAFFANEHFKGAIYRLQDIVIDTSSLVSALSEPLMEHIFKADPVLEMEGSSISAIKLADGARVVADRYILTAGAGNEALLEQCNSSLTMQRRPLHQVMVKSDLLPNVFAHAVSLSAGAKPRLTISTHPTNDGSRVWYLGGNLAETGVDRGADEQCSLARNELKSLFPWMDWDQMDYHAFRIDRAEPAQADLSRPDSPFAKRIGNAIVCWPTKLTLAPLLADDVELLLKDLPPSGARPEPPGLPHPEQGKPPWETCF